MKSALLRSSRLAASTLLASFAFGFCSEVNAQSRIDLPAGGWRTSMDSRTGFVQEVNYPASSVNSDGKAAPALIRGHIQQRIEQAIQRQVGGSAKPDNSHGRQPATLVANGVAMPLAVVQTGAFNRPYALAQDRTQLKCQPGVFTMSTSTTTALANFRTRSPLPKLPWSHRKAVCMRNARCSGCRYADPAS